MPDQAFCDLLQDLEEEIQRIANYLNIKVAKDLLPQIANAVTFKAVKQNAEHYEPGLEEKFEGGSQTFIYKGTNGRWRDVLTDDDLILYKATLARELSPDCARWLESGRLDDA